MSKPVDQKFKLIGEGTYAIYEDLTEDNIVEGLRSGKYILQTIGELYADYGLWGRVLAHEIKVSGRAECEEELEGVFLEGKCFIFNGHIVGLWRKEWLRIPDHKLIYEYYAIVKK